ncbi:hypothetical protein DSO57_1032737 [Entomophthora muscae]|uniref:Uncharacterized protein n=1 Tax=Entomophthora muscae TaxID=34485 RepID=A0ACC2TM64_9FUNG|nr:hypothetical protein DSO57_1032737 [Entomophthora muscae]
MSAQDYTKGFTFLMNNIGMSNNKACYLFCKKIYFELKNFLVNYELPTNFDIMVNSHPGESFNPLLSPPHFILRRTEPSLQKSKGMFPKD